MKYSDMNKLAKHLNGIKYENYMRFSAPNNGRLEVNIPLEVRENPRAEELDIPDAQSIAFPEENLRRDSLRDVRAKIDELVEMGIIKDREQVQLRTVAGGGAEEHMDWATMNRAGRDEDGAILGGRYVDAKIVIPAGAIDHDKVADMYVVQKAVNHRDKVNKALDGLAGISVEDIVMGLAARTNSADMADAMMAALGKYDLRQDFIAAWNNQADLKKQNGVEKPLRIVADSGKSVEAGDSWAERTANRTGRALE